MHKAFVTGAMGPISNIETEKVQANILTEMNHRFDPRFYFLWMQGALLDIGISIRYMI